MDPRQLINPIKDLFLKHSFELCDESSDEENLSLSFIKKDFRVEAMFDSHDNTLDLRLDRPSFDFIDEQVVLTMEEITLMVKTFIDKIDALIASDELLPSITRDDCELFLRTGGYDGIGSGVIEYKGSLYYFKSITSNYHKDRSREDHKNQVWRRFYIYEMTKEELETVVMSSLDRIRHVNLSSLCKDWKSMRLDTGTETEKNKYFRGKYSKPVDIKSNPVMKLTLLYSQSV